MMHPVLNQGADIAVILPAYPAENEEQTIGSTIGDFHRPPKKTYRITNSNSVCFARFERRVASY